ncbi:MAG: hypothetical protein JW808_00690 [Victivallales bacterium]|nr:hypothetical protein [Victivallales bacterium]
MMQSSRDAVDCILRGKRADFVPLYDNPWCDAMEKWLGEGYPKDKDGKPCDSNDFFGFDLVGCGGWFSWHPKKNIEEILEENEEWKITRSGSGAVMKKWKTRSGTPEHIDFHMTTRKIWEDEYRHCLLDLDKDRVDVKSAKENLKMRRSQKKFTFFGNQFVWETIRHSLGDENMLVTLIEDPEWVKDFNRVYTDFWITHYKYLFQEAGLPDGVWIYEDLGYRDKLFCSPMLLQELFFPYYTEMVKFFHSYDLPVVFHSCGYQSPMIPLVIEAGFDALNPMEVKAGNNIFEYAEKYGDKLAFVGGFDARILESGDKALIKKSVTDFICGMEERNARFIFGSDHSISTCVRLEDFRYALNIYRDLKHYPNSGLLIRRK